MLYCSPHFPWISITFSMLICGPQEAKKCRPRRRIDRAIDCASRQARLRAARSKTNVWAQPSRLKNEQSSGDIVQTWEQLQALDRTNNSLESTLPTTRIFKASRFITICEGAMKYQILRYRNILKLRTLMKCTPLTRKSFNWFFVWKSATPW